MHTNIRKCFGIGIAYIKDMKTNHIQTIIFCFFVLFVMGACGGIGAGVNDALFDNAMVSEDGLSQEIMTGESDEGDSDEEVLGQSDDVIPQDEFNEIPTAGQESAEGMDDGDYGNDSPTADQGNKATDANDEKDLDDPDYLETETGPTSLPVTIAKEEPEEGDACEPEEEGERFATSLDVTASTPREAGEKIGPKGKKISTKIGTIASEALTEEGVDVEYVPGVKVIECRYNEEENGYYWQKIPDNIVYEEYDLNLRFVDTGEEETTEFTPQGTMLLDQSLLEVSEETDVCVTLVEKETNQKVSGTGLVISNKTVKQNAPKC